MLLLATVFCVALPNLAQETQEKAYKLVANFNQTFYTDMVSLPFADRPKIVVEGDWVKFSGETISISFTHEQLDKFTIEPISPSIPTGVALLGDDQTFRLCDNGMIVKGRPHSMVRLFDMGGKLVSSQSIGRNGETTINVNLLQQGSYIMQVEKETIKFQKK